MSVLHVLPDVIQLLETVKRLLPSVIINAVVENGRIKLDLPRILVLHVLLDVTPFPEKHKHLLVFVLIARPACIPMLVLLNVYFAALVKLLK